MFANAFSSTRVINFQILTVGGHHGGLNLTNLNRSSTDIYVLMLACLKRFLFYQNIICCDWVVTNFLPILLPKRAIETEAAVRRILPNTWLPTFCRFSRFLSAHVGMSGKVFKLWKHHKLWLSNEWSSANILLPKRATEFEAAMKSIYTPNT